MKNAFYHSCSERCYGPGGFCGNRNWREVLVAYARRYNNKCLPYNAQYVCNVAS